MDIHSHSWTLKLFIIAVVIGGYSRAESTTLQLTGEVCSTNQSLSVHEELTVSVFASSIGPQCDVTFYTQDPQAQLSFRFGGDWDEDLSYIGDGLVSIYFYSIEGDSETLLFGYTEWNSTKMRSDEYLDLSSNRLMVVMNGDNMDHWYLVFTLKSSDGLASDYPISLACGVFALSLGATTGLALLSVCVWWCCCRPRETPEQAAARRRRRMIDQLAKEGYSVTRDYGSISSTTHFMRNEGDVVDIFSQPQEQASTSATSRYEPPPSYDSVRSHRPHTVAMQAPAGYSQTAYQHYMHTPPVTGDTHHQVASVPEGILVEIEANGGVSANAPPPDTPQPTQQDLIQL